MSDLRRVDRLGGRDALTVADVLSGRAPAWTLTGRIRAMPRRLWPAYVSDRLIEIMPTAAIVASWGTIGYTYGGPVGLLAGVLAGGLTAVLVIVFVHRVGADLRE